MGARLAGGVACVLAALVAAAPACADTGYSRPEQYGIEPVTTQKVRMSDGTELAADVYYPTGKGPFPVILTQTPYGRSSVTTTKGYTPFGGDGYFPYLVKRGYINVIADVRGSGNSGGDFGLFSPRDAQDGAELVRWAARLPRSDGKVGAAGYSYVGLNQIFTAAKLGRGSPLKAIVPSAAGFDLYRDLAFGGGLPNTVFAAGWAGLRSTMLTADPSQIAARAAGYANLDASLYTEIERGGERAFDSPFWQVRRPGSQLAQVVRNGIPALMLSGWFDVYQRGVLLNYATLQNAWTGRRHIYASMLPGQKATPRYQAVIGPWFHNPVGMGEWIQQIHLEWFDHWLKGKPTALTSTSSPLHLFELGAKRWVDAGAYPLPQSRVRRLWPGAGRSGTARLSLNDGVLDARAPTAEAASDPLPWTGASSPCNRGPDQWSTGFGGLVSAYAGMPVNPCHEHDGSTQAGALSYTTAPLTHDVTIAGPVSVGVYMSSTTPDSELVATLDDVSAGDSSFPLTTGALLGSLRAVDASRSWPTLPYHPYTAASRRDLEPGKVTLQQIEVPPVFARIAKGHRLRLTLSSSVSHLTPTAAQLPGLAGGLYDVERDRTHASYVDLPLADPANLPAAKRDWGPCNGQC
jgi:hypothetical protein